MQTVTLAHEVDFAAWRNAARRLALEGVPPEQVLWCVGAPSDLFADALDPPPGSGGPDPASAPGSADSPDSAAPARTFSVGRALVDLAETVVQARDPERFALLYGLVWRAQHGERQITSAVTDPAVQRAMRLAQSVRRDTHKMRAFLRFRAVEPGPGMEGGTRHVAWFEPEHFIVEANAGFFVRRFATMVFSILTPYRSFHWTGTEEHFGPGASRADIPDDDALERYWRAYYGAIFNPARLKIAAMRSEMPKKYWRNLPEAALIPDLVRNAASRTAAMVARPPSPSLTRPEGQATVMRDARTEPSLDLLTPGSAERPGTAPDAASDGARAETIPLLSEAAAACRRCDLWSHATQTVFGEGPHDARMMMIGEQPGDQEDLAGRPFVGPAGQLLDRALAEAGIDRRAVYVTNAVKHFKFEPRGKRRIHQKPDTAEIAACNVWVEAERRLVRPSTVVLLGATAARAVLGRAVTISRERGRPIDGGDGSRILVTVHPSYLLRLPDEAAKQREYAAFVSDLELARTMLQQTNAAGD